MERSLPPYVWQDQDTMTNILYALMVGEMTCWTMVRGLDDVLALATTIVTDDFASKTRNFLIYSMFAFREVTPDEWRQGGLSLMRYAADKNCKQIIAYTKVQAIVDIVKMMGGEAEYLFCTTPVVTDV